MLLGIFICSLLAASLAANYSLKFVQNPWYLRPHYEKDKHFDMPPSCSIKTNTFLSAFGSKRCLVVVDNYYGVNMYDINHPIVLRKYRHAHIISLEVGIKTNLSVWAATNVNVSSVQCKSQYHVSGIFKANEPNVNGHCVELDLDKFSSNSKAWNCEAHVAIFLPPTRLRVLYFEFLQIYPLVFSFHNYPRTWFKMPPSIGTSYEVVVLKNLKSFEYLYYQILLAVGPQKRRVMDDFKKSFVKTVLYLDVVQRSSKGVVQNSEKNFNVKNWHLVCFDPLRDYQGVLKPVNPKFNKFYDLAACVKLGERVQLGYFGDYYEAYNPIGYSVRKHFTLCNNQMSVKFKAFQFTTEKTQRLAHAFAHEFATIFKNYSYTVAPTGFQNFECVNGKRVNNGGSKWKKWYTVELMGSLTTHNYSSLAYWALVIKDKVEQLRFISCGERDLPLLPFHELTSVYDIYIWLLTMLSCLTVAVIPLLFHHSTVTSISSVLKNLDFVFRIVLGLDICVGKRFENMQAFRFILSAFMLAMLVLSNAYKSDNMYRIVLPRKLLPLETLEQLIKQRFTVLSELMGLFLFLKPNTKTRYFRLNTNDFDVDLWDPRYGLHVRSSVTYMHKMSGRDNSDQLLFEYARLDNATTNFLIQEETYENVLKNKQQHEILWHFKKLDTDNRIRCFKACDNVALVLPIHRIEEYLKDEKIVGKNISKFVDVGKTDYFQPHQVFSLQSVVPSFVFRRMKRLQESGVFDWWQKFLGGSGQFKKWREKEIEVQTPKMSGNILVIFVLLMGGLGISFCLLLFELPGSCFSMVVKRPLYKFKGILSFVGRLIGEMISFRFGKFRPTNFEIK